MGIALLLLCRCREEMTLLLLFRRRDLLRMGCMLRMVWAVWRLGMCNERANVECHEEGMSVHNYRIDTTSVHS